MFADRWERARKLRLFNEGKKRQEEKNARNKNNVIW